jgi:Family of unknown function (DUF6328)
MALAGKVKTALDETRTLILGAQILLGFQFQAAFQERFETLSLEARVASAIALGLMLASAGLLIAPSAYHRIADQGESTGRIQFLTGYCAAAALLAFAAALGLDLAITLERVLGNATAGIVAGILFAVMASTGWYGLGLFMKRSQGAAERSRAHSKRCLRETAPLHTRIEQMLTEARVILPGAQALLGFQLVIVFTSAFENLPGSSRLVHGVALLCVALSVILLITPAALHRIVWAGEDTEAFLGIGGALTILALLPLALGMSGDSYVVLARMSGSSRVGTASAAITLSFLLVLWFAWPFTLRQSGSSARPISACRKLDEAEL